MGDPEAHIQRLRVQERGKGKGRSTKGVSGEERCRVLWVSRGDVDVYALQQDEAPGGVDDDSDDPDNPVH